MYAEWLLEHFRFLRDRPTICKAKTMRHVRKNINKSKIYPWSKKFGMMINVSSKYV